MKFLIKNEKGQTATEYMMLLVVAFTIGTTFKKKIEEFLISNPNSVISKQINNFTNEFNADPRFSFFPLRR